MFIVVHLLNNYLDKNLKQIHLYWIIREIIVFEYCKSKKVILIRSEGFYQRLLFYLLELDKTKISFIENFLIKRVPNIDKVIILQTTKKESIKTTQKRRKGFKFDNETILSFDNVKLLISNLNKIKKFLNKKNKKQLICLRKYENFKKIFNNINNECS